MATATHAEIFCAVVQAAEVDKWLEDFGNETSEAIWAQAGSEDFDDVFHY